MIPGVTMDKLMVTFGSFNKFTQSYIYFISTYYGLHVTLLR
jgi:hypothetical protein